MRTRSLLVMAAVVGALCFAAPGQADIINTDIPALQDTTSALWDTLQTGVDTLVVEGVITGADTRATGFGFFIELPSSDAPVGNFFRGTLVFTGGSNTFADSGYARGDRVQVMGIHTEFNNGSELISLSGGAFGPPPPTTLLGSEAVPGPILVNPGDIAFNALYQIAEPYEGMFARMNGNMRVGSSGVTDPRIGPSFFLAVEDIGPALDSVLVDMFTMANPALTAPANGTTITLLQGIAYQGALGYDLRPRDGFDILAATPPNLSDAYAISNDSIRVVFDQVMDQTTAEDLLNYSRSGGALSLDAAILQVGGQHVHLATTSEPQVSPNIESIAVSGVVAIGGGTMIGTQFDQWVGGITPITEMQTPAGPKYAGPAGSDTSQFIGQTITTRGVVLARFGSLVWIGEETGGLRSGFQLFAPNGPMAVGDDVTTVGTPIEFFDQTEFSGTFFERNHGAGTIPAPMVVSSSDLSTFNDSSGTVAREDYEAILVEIQDVAVRRFDAANSNEVTMIPSANWALWPTDADSVRIDNRGSVVPGWGSIFLGIGTTYSSVVGAWEITSAGFTRGRMQPRDSTDFSPTSGAVSVDGPALRLVLKTPAPNPVSFSQGAANISFTLPRKGAVGLRMYDIRGRLIRTLADGQIMAAGPHVLKWNGTDNSGTRVRSGIYFVQLRLEKEVATGKVVVAE